MRNPIRSKNFDLRFAPAGVAGVVLLALSAPEPRSIALGAPLVLAGLAIRAWAVGHLVKTEQFTFTGPYAHLRHPLYVGTLAIGVGIAAMLGGLAGLVGAAAVIAWFALRYMPRKDRVETERLLDRHGPVYARYRDEVPALWPRMRAWHPDPEPVADGGRLARIAAQARAQPGAWRFERFDANNELGTVIAVGLAVLGVCLRAGLV